MKLEFKYLPLPQFEPEASIAAQSTECAADQGQFWPYHDHVFEVAASQGRGGLSIPDLVNDAEAMGLNREEFSECLAGATHASAIQASRGEAATLGVGSTPTVFVNGVMMPSAFDIDGISAEIEQLLSGS